MQAETLNNQIFQNCRLHRNSLQRERSAIENESCGMHGLNTFSMVRDGDAHFLQSLLIQGQQVNQHDGRGEQTPVHRERQSAQPRHNAWVVLGYWGQRSEEFSNPVTAGLVEILEL